jgi:hypothetical protein
VLSPNNKELGLRLLHPCLPLRIIAVQISGLSGSRGEGCRWRR